jgi:hypothetical protein
MACIGKNWHRLADRKKQKMTLNRHRIGMHWQGFAPILVRIDRLKKKGWLRISPRLALDWLRIGLRSTEDWPPELVQDWLQIASGLASN